MEKSHSRRGRKSSWEKRLVVLLGALVVLLIAGYFVVTSSGFIKSVVLPKAGAAINARVSAEAVSLSPFSRLQLQGLRVETTGTEPLLTAQEVQVRYSLMDIIKGKIKVDEVTLSGPVLQIIRQPDGTSNLDPILKGVSDADDSSKPGETTQLSVQNFSLKNGTVRQVQHLNGGGAETTELNGLNITIDRLGNGQSGKLALNSGLKLANSAGATNDTLTGNISGGYDLTLNQELLPQAINGSTKLNVSSATGTYADLTGFAGSLDADLTPKELRRVALVFSKNNQPLGEIRASGPLDLDRGDGNLKIEILSLDKNALALVYAGSGLDFRQTQINSTNQVTISQGATFFAASGNLNGEKISFSQDGASTPEMAIQIDYQVSVNTAEKSAMLQKLVIAGSTDGKQFLRSDLDRQMNLSWGEAVKSYRDAALHLVVTNFNLAEWRALVGTNVQAGMLQANLSVTAQQDGKLLKSDLKSRIQGLTAVFGTNRVQNSDLTFDLDGTVEQLKIINIAQYSFALREGATEVFQGNGAVHYELESKNAKAQLTARGHLPRLLAIAAVPNVTAQEGKLEFTANFSESGGQRKGLGSVTLGNFTGSYDSYLFKNFQLNFEYNLEMDSRKVDIRRAVAAFNQDFNAGGIVDLKGQYNLVEKSGQFTFRTVDLNQNAFQPFLAPSLGENKLVSIALNSTGEITVDPKGENAIKANLKVSNWVVQKPLGTLPKTPMAAELSLNAGMRQEKLDLRALDLALSPTARAKNQLQILGKLDLAQTNPTPSTLTLKAESLDLTPYYEMFASATNAASPPPPAPSASKTEENAEPPPATLPFQQLAADLKIDQFYLREVAISNWTGQLTMRSNVVEIRPFKFDLNGGRMDLTANIDTSIPGYRYDIGFQAANVPLLPLVNTFGSGISNQLDGMFLADARIAGAGTTGPNLRKNLGGQFAFSLTNLNYKIVGPKLRLILVPISLALNVPELLQTPLNSTSMRAELGRGVVDFKQIGIESEAFQAETAGPITLNDVLTNSTLNFPLTISLRRSLAEKSRLISADTPTNAKYAKLPQFVSVKGTVGLPESDINKLVVAGLVARGAVGLGLTGGSETVNQVLGTVGDLLTGQRGATNAGGTNAPETNASPIGSIFQGIGGLLGGSTNATKTNAAETATNAPAQANPLDLRRIFPRKQN